MNKCCNYTDNTDPTLDQCKAIETNWNKFINDFYKEIDDKYPDTNLTKVDLNQGTLLLKNTVTGLVKKHATTNRSMYRVSSVDLDVMEIADEEVSVLRLKGHLVDEEDGYVHHNMQIGLNTERMIVAVATNYIPLDDEKLDEVDADKVTHKGLNNALSAKKVTLRKHQGHMQYGGYEREELIIDTTWKTL